MSSVELKALKFLHLTGSAGSQEVVQGKACGEHAVPSACLRSVNDLCCRDKSLAYWFSSPLMNSLTLLSPHYCGVLSPSSALTFVRPDQQIKRFYLRGWEG